MKKSLSTKSFGIFENKPVTAYTLCNENGMQVTVINYGATITQIITPDKEGIYGNVILGFDTLEGYLQNGHQYQGCIVGRYANRIAGPGFTLADKYFRLPSSFEHFCLHSGPQGFSKQWWEIMVVDDNTLRLTYLSKDGEAGFPGNLYTELIYTLTGNNTLILDYKAQTDQPTPVNLTNHCYLNLSAGKSPDILQHELKVYADWYTLSDEHLLPTGKLAELKNTPMDFSVFKRIGNDIGKVPGGYDHNLILNDPQGKAAELYDSASGRLMEMFTTEPALQLYTGNALHFDNETNKSKSPFVQYQGLCLEAQHYPDSPNQPTFPNTILSPGETYRQTTRYAFSVK